VDGPPWIKYGCHRWPPKETLTCAVDAFFVHPKACPCKAYNYRAIAITYNNYIYSYIILSLLAIIVIIGYYVAIVAIPLSPRQPGPRPFSSKLYPCSRFYDHQVEIALIT